MLSSEPITEARGMECSDWSHASPWTREIVSILPEPLELRVGFPKENKDDGCWNDKNDIFLPSVLKKPIIWDHSCLHFHSQRGFLSPKDPHYIHHHYQYLACRGIQMGCSETDLPDRSSGTQEIWTEANCTDADQTSSHQLMMVYSAVSRSELRVEECNNWLVMSALGTSKKDRSMFAMCVLSWNISMSPSCSNRLKSRSRQ